MKPFFKIALLSIFFVSACGIPKDPGETFAQAKSKHLKVGIVDNPPYAVIEDGKYTGIEVTLINELALKNNLKIEFIEGSESNLIKKLEHREIDIFIGGFGKKSVWTEKAGSTTEYDGEHIILIPKGENRLLFELESVINQHSKA